MNINQLFIDLQIANSPEALSIQSLLNIEATYISSTRDFYQKIQESPDPIQAGKESLLLTQNKGAFIKKCPGTTSYICCGYQILHIASFCSMDCSYCILQSYFHPPVLQYFVNHENLMDELDLTFSKPGIKRIGTGEFTDSLIWEEFGGISAKLIQKFAGQGNSVLELKSKTAKNKALLDLVHNGKTIMAWSVNTPRIIKSEERKTASLKARLESAKEYEQKGYPLAFHFDPIILYPACEIEYRQVVDMIVSYVSSENIAWISVGTFRFMPDLKTIIKSRFKSSKIIYGEFIRGLDDKMRYFKPLRARFYMEFISYLRKRAPETMIYFCMEDEELWQTCFGYKPSEKGGLSKLLDDRASKLCGLTN